LVEAYTLKENIAAPLDPTPEITRGATVPLEELIDCLELSFWEDACNEILLEQFQQLAKLTPISGQNSFPFSLILANMMPNMPSSVIPVRYQTNISL
jgi:hypothetical protein